MQRKVEKMKSKTKGGICLVVSVICFIIGFLMIPASESFKPTSVNIYANSTHLTEGYVGGQPKLLEISNIMLWVGIALGALFLILSIYYFVKKDTSK